MRVFTLFATAAASAMLSGCGSPKPNTEPTPPATSAQPGAAPETTAVAAGKAIFQANCIACHGANGKGIGKGKPDFTDAEWQAKESDEELLEVIANGHEKMPAFGDKLTEEQRKEVLAYVRTFPTQQP